MSERLTAEQVIDGVESGDLGVIRYWVEDPHVCHSELGLIAMRHMLTAIDALRDDLRHAVDCDGWSALQHNTMPPQLARCPQCEAIRKRLEER